MSEQITPRREFLGQVAASAIVLAGTACAAPAATVASTASPAAGSASPRQSGSDITLPPAPAQWDDSWFAKLTAKHRAVFDSPEIEDGLVLGHATGYIRGMRDALGAADSDVQTVVVLRHTAVVMLFNDAMWEKYTLGKLRNVKAPRSEAWATKNPFVGTASERPAAGTPDRPQANLMWLATRGHIILGCDLAMRNMSGVLARQTNGDATAIYEDLKANMLPGVILQPTGVYACHRAQEAGCSYIRST